MTDQLKQVQRTQYRVLFASMFANMFDDRKSTVAAILVGGLFGLLAYLSLAISRIDGPIATIWLPNAVATSILLYSAVRTIQPTLIALFVGSSLANLAFGFPVNQAVTFAFANTIEVTIAVMVTRRVCDGRPDMADIRHLGQFLLAGGLLAPLASSIVATIALSSGGGLNWTAGLSWFATDGLGQILVTPAMLLLADAIVRARANPQRIFHAEFALIFCAGSAITYLVFSHNAVSLLFLIPPIVVLHAFRLGSFGTAMFILQLTLIATINTRQGLGPIALAVGSIETKLLLIQAFVAANALTGLPVAAILASRKNAFRSLAASRSELALLTTSITDAVLRINREGTCVYASPSVHDVMGAPPEQFVGKKPTDRIHPESKHEFQRVFLRLINGKVDRERLIYRRFLDHPDGRAAYLDAQGAVIRDQTTGEADGFVVSVRDVTEQIELERELILARKRAEQAANAKTAFLANMSHEIRTPMNGVIGFADLLLDSELNDEQRRHAELIARSGRSMMLLLNDILDLSKVEAGALSIDHQPVDLNALIEECVSLHQANASTKGVKVQLKETGKLPVIYSDRLRIQQILLNLIDNAVKFTDQGNVSIHSEHVGSHVSIRVSDQGIGISEDHQETIFQPFGQVEDSNSRKHQGTGLGLSICRQLVELMGGSIELRSTLGEGSTFLVILPTNPPPAYRQARRKLSAMADAKKDPSSSKILLVEDNEVNMLLVRDMLKRCGQDVHIAKNGDEAVVMTLDASMRDEPFDLILMDIQMPGCDGYTATKMIRDEGIPAHQLPIIALTANAFPEDVIASRKAGMQAHLAKPIGYSELVEALQRWLPTTIVDRSDSLPAAMELSPHEGENS